MTGGGMGDTENREVGRSAGKCKRESGRNLVKNVSTSKKAPAGSASIRRGEPGIAEQMPNRQCSHNKATISWNRRTIHTTSGEHCAPACVLWKTGHAYLPCP